MSTRKKLLDLRLTDLKQELEKRNLEQTGSKVELQTRLEEALIAEGKSPSEYLFSVDEADDGRHSSDNLAEDLATAQPVATSHDSAKEVSGNEDHMEVRNETGDLIYDDEEESDILADSGGLRNHPLHQDNVHSPSRQTDSNGGFNDAAGDSTQNATNGDSKNESATAKEATSDSQHPEDENEDELNRSREFIKSSKIPKETDEEKVKSRNLWVSNLSARVKAQDLTTMFAKYGPTDGAKVIISNRDQDSPYGFVTMATVEAADECVKQLDGSEWNGKNIKVEKIARDPTSSASSTNQNGGGGETKNRRKVSATSRRSTEGGGEATRRIAASDRRRLGAKGGEEVTVSSTVEVAKSAVESVETGTGAKSETNDEKDGKEKDIEYYKRKARRDYETIRDLQNAMERNRRRSGFLIQREREKANRIEMQCRNNLRRERELLASERDLLDKRRSDLDRFEKSIVDRERLLKERERHLDDKDRDYMPRQNNPNPRPPTTLSASTYGPAQQSAGRYYSNPPVSSSAASKRPYEGGSNWESKRMASRSDYPSDRQSNSQSYGTSYRGNNSSSGGRGGRNYEDRGGYGGGDDSNNSSRSRRRFVERGPPSGGVTSSSVAHWVKPVNHRPPFVGGGGDMESGGDSSWSRGGGMQGGRRF